MKRWIPMPVSWASSLEWLTLTPKARILLHLLWCRTPDGTVPRDPKRAQLLAGVSDKPSRVGTALEELTTKGFLEVTESGFFLAQYRQIFRKFSSNSAQKVGRTLPKKQTRSEGSTSGPRGRVLSLKERETMKEENTQRPSAPSVVSSGELEALRERLK